MQLRKLNKLVLILRKQLERETKRADAAEQRVAELVEICKAHNMRYERMSAKSGELLRELAKKLRETAGAIDTFVVRDMAPVVSGELT